MVERVAVLLDGGFVKKCLQRRLQRFPAVADVVGIVDSLLQHQRLRGAQLYRAFFYDCPPITATVKNPIDGSTVDLGNTAAARQNQALMDALELQPDFAVRRGELICTGWKLGKAAMKNLAGAPRAVTASDFVPDITQKGVDIRIALDLASIALKRVASIGVVVSGDSDLIPVMKLARTEGMKIYLDTLTVGQARRDLKAHSDFVL